MKVEDMYCPCCGVLFLVGKEILKKTMRLELMWDAYWYDPETKGCAPRLKISSGYRCELHNITIGGSDASQHMKGKAMDICKRDGTPLTEEEASVLWRLAEEVGFTGIILYDEHIHVDTRGWIYKKNKRGDKA